MDTKNISFFECDDESYIIVDNYLFNSRFCGYEDSYNYYDINVNNIIPYKKSYNEYVIRYIDANKSIFTPLQLKIQDFSDKMEIYTNDDKVMFIYSDDESFLKNVEKNEIGLLS